MSGKRIVFSVKQLTKHLKEVLELNLFQESETEKRGGLTYQSTQDRVKTLSEEKVKLAKKLRFAPKSLDYQEQKITSPVS